MPDKGLTQLSKLSILIGINTDSVTFCTLPNNSREHVSKPLIPLCA
jgi:hypothetical protein